MFCIEIPTIYETVEGNKLTLSVGGVRAYNHMNLYSKKTVEKFKGFYRIQEYGMLQFMRFNRWIFE